ncbi:Glucose/arabinose dehydrogenase, beta-propeller fold [Flavobacterium aquidurense]|uniref:Glucose dehydrogenase n=1 Tax=Flavobacterium frigidimaris TaxID=262320 RepID=A0ABX4BKC4_FLAFR|nr:PQQ-dependent sugar dehydrogenase [Flavobacterium frigidimaris]OXA75920.1 glucose dehydrogenase [Flavobacterium frigidimaris]SDZ64032.1 Glucose/arabinose dehydrogenase, beta-propeller fold [Flavobacterium aquidurense]
MRHFNYITILSSALLMACSCSNDKDPATNPDPGTSTNPVENNPANSNYSPAFSGQTRIGGLQTNTSYEAKIITSALTSPWGVKSLPDGRLLITQKAGTMRIVSVTGEVSSPITGIPTVNPAGQGGLLGLCLDPDFSTNKMIYWVFSEASTGGNQTSVAKGKLSADEKTIEGAVVIYRANPANPSDLHYGGRILFDQTGNLIVSTGERSVLQTRPLAQSVSAGLGKVIRITKNGQAAPGNPTFTGAGALPELYSIGHRNPQGLAFNSVTNEIWLAEHGPRGGDEINRLKPGANYGWPTITYGIEYSGEKVGAGIQKQDGMEQPVYYWDPVVSPSGMTFYTGNRVPEWQNNLFIGALSGMHIVRLAIENNKVIGEERLLAGEGQRFRDITQGNDGALYAITDQGRLYKIDKK